MRIEQNGSESAELSSNNNFVIVQVPVTVPGEVPKSGVGSRFSIGSFQGRETTLLRATGTQVQLIFRIPREHFRPSALLDLEIVARDQKGQEKILWAKRYEVAWQGKAPHLEPIAD